MEGRPQVHSYEVCHSTFHKIAARGAASRQAVSSTVAGHEKTAQSAKTGYVALSIP